MPNPYDFMGVPMRLAGKAEVLAAIDAATPERPARIATANGEFYLKAADSPAFKDALAWMTHATVDGSGPFFMLRLWTFLRREKPFERYAGADLVADLFNAYKDGSKSFFFLGGPSELVEGAARTVRLKYPEIDIVGMADGGRIDAENVTPDPALIARIKEAKPDILLVGFGAPKQELWMRAASDGLSVPVMVGVGGTFGFYHDKKRAPGALRFLGLEWLSRLFREPGHYKRVWRAVVVFSFKAVGWMARSPIRKAA